MMHAMSSKPHEVRGREVRVVGLAVVPDPFDEMDTLTCPLGISPPCGSTSGKRSERLLVRDSTPTPPPGGPFTVPEDSRGFQDAAPPPRTWNMEHGTWNRAHHFRQNQMPYGAVIPIT